MGPGQTSFVEGASAPLGLSEATVARFSCVHILVLEASCLPTSVVLSSLHQVPAALHCFSDPKISIPLLGLVTLGLSPNWRTFLLSAEPADGEDSSRRKPDAALRALNAKISAFLPRARCLLSRDQCGTVLCWEPSAISRSVNQEVLILVIFFLPLMQGCWWLLFLLVSLLVTDNSLLESTITQLANRLFHKGRGLQGLPSLPIKDTRTGLFLGLGVSKPMSRTGTSSLPLPWPGLASHGRAACRGVYGPWAAGKGCQGGTEVSAAPCSSGRKDKCLQARPAPAGATDIPSWAVPAATLLAQSIPQGTGTPFPPSTFCLE